MNLHLLSMQLPLYTDFHALFLSSISYFLCVANVVNWNFLGLRAHFYQYDSYWILVFLTYFWNKTDTAGREDYFEIFFLLKSSLWHKIDSKLFLLLLHSVIMMDVLVQSVLYNLYHFSTIENEKGKQKSTIIWMR